MNFRVLLGYFVTSAVLIVSAVDLKDFGITENLSLLAKSALGGVCIAAGFARLALRFPRLELSREAFGLCILAFSVASLSVFWTISLSYTVVALLASCASVGAAFYLAGFPLSESLSILCKTLLGFIVISVLYIAVSPDAFVEHHGVPRFQGIFFGPHAMAQPVAACFGLLLVNPVFKKTWVRGVVLALLGVILLVTFSRQAHIAVMLSLVTFYLFTRAKLLQSARVPLGIAAIAGLLLFMLLNQAHLLDFLSRGEGDDVATLTGRTAIWSAALDLGRMRPLIGYGYGAGGVALEIFYSAGLGEWRTFNAHNAILQVFIDLGVLGVIIFLAFIAFCIRNAIRVFGVQVLPLVVVLVVPSLVERGVYASSGILVLLFWLLVFFTGTRRAA